MIDHFLVQFPPGAAAVLEAAMEGGLGDGLPIIPPTREAVARMLRAVRRAPESSLGVMAPMMAEVTVEEAALCAVAAGCLPEHFPVVVAALEAIMDEEFNLLAIQATTELASPLLIVNGPAAARLGVHGGSGCLGPGFRANAAIGRAVRLAAMRLGGAIPGETDMATFGHGGKFTACLAENEAESPWEPLHVARGLRPAQSAVTLVGADPPVNVNDFASGGGEGVLRMIAETMSYPGSNNAQGGGEVLVIASPQHAQLLAREGWGRRDVQERLFELARVPMRRFSPEIAERVRGKRPWLFEKGGAEDAPVADGPDSILIAVAGGPGSHTLFVPTYGETRAMTKPFAEERTA